MAFFAHVSLTVVLSAAVAMIASRRWPWGDVAVLVPLSTGLWVILDGIWQPTYAFSVVEPSLLVVVLAALALIAVTRQGRIIGGAIASFIASGMLATAIALQTSSDPIAMFHEAIRSGSPMIAGGLVAISVVWLGRQRNWGMLPTFSAALAAGLILDSSLYTAWVQPYALWQHVDWVQPLLTKVADKLLLASTTVITIWLVGGQKIQHHWSDHQ